MPTKTPRILLELRYHKAAQEYQRNLTLEDYMESTPQATQREITLESLALVRGRRPEVQVFNELLVQYPKPRQKKPGQVVPDNMVVIHPEPIKAIGSYDVALQPARPFWVLEYVSKSNPNKDTDESMPKYEHELKVPYFLLFVPEQQELTLYRHTGRRYVAVRPNKQGRCNIADLELSVAVLDGWVRYWYQGELLPLPAELQHTLDETRKQLADATRRADEQTRRAETAEHEIERLRAQLAELQSKQKKNH